MKPYILQQRRNLEVFRLVNMASRVYLPSMLDMELLMIALFIILLGERAESIE